MMVSLKSGHAIPSTPFTIGESLLQRHISNNLHELFNVKLIQTEYTLKLSDGRNGRIDILGIDPDGTLVVFELKSNKSRTHLNQALEYAHAFLNTPFSEIPGYNGKVRVVCIAKEFTQATIISAYHLNVPVELYNYTIYGGDAVHFQRVYSYRVVGNMCEYKNINSHRIIEEENVRVQRMTTVEKDPWIHIFKDIVITRNLIGEIEVNKLLEHICVYLQKMGVKLEGTSSTVSLGNMLTKHASILSDIGVNLSKYRKKEKGKSVRGWIIGVVHDDDIEKKTNN